MSVDHRLDRLLCLPLVLAHLLRCFSDFDRLATVARREASLHTRLQPRPLHKRRPPLRQPRPLHPLMEQQIGGGAATFRILAEALEQKIFTRSGNRASGRELGLHMENAMGGVVGLVVAESGVAVEHLISDDRDGPGVALFIVIQLRVVLAVLVVPLPRVLQHLGTHVLRGPRSRHRALLLLVHRQPEVRHLQRHVLPQQHVLRLQVAVDDALAVDIVQRRKQRPHH
mmetsp:Transcript_27646/g.49331  ORF Transcript_27646/g.49331 Transcript_27646/m.49331 type:complete len:227 (+) Transcript_27646:173-853(+)